MSHGVRQAFPDTPVSPNAMSIRPHDGQEGPYSGAVPAPWGPSRLQRPGPVTAEPHYTDGHMPNLLSVRFTQLHIPHTLHSPSPQSQSEDQDQKELMEVTQVTKGLTQTDLQGISLLHWSPPPHLGQQISCC